MLYLLLFIISQILTLTNTHFYNVNQRKFTMNHLDTLIIMFEQHTTHNQLIETPLVAWSGHS